MNFKKCFLVSFSYLSLIITLASCTKIDLYEKVVTLPDFHWPSTYKPQFKFQITDTAAPYQIYVVIRHNDKYNWNNIWLNLYTAAPGDSIRKIQYELPLANKERWLGTAMGDLYEHRVLITPRPIFFKHAGEYTYTIEQTMREDPLENILNIGLRVEKKSQ